MKESVEHLIALAWRRVRLQLLGDPAALRRRLARRDSPLLMRPPRAWCLAIRANDTRLESARCSAEPLAEHQLMLATADIRRLTAPVYIDRPGEPLLDVARKLGVTQSSLVDARLKGIFRVRHVEGLNAHFAKPHPILYTDQPLDPSTRGFVMPDPIWSTTAALLRRDIPEIDATLTRVPVFHDATRDYRDKSGLHPEHPDRDKVAAASSKSKSRKLPPPEPDPVPYKWKDGVYVGHDWRNPLAAANHARKQHEARLRHEGYLRRRAANRPPSAATGSKKFMGWNWVCPTCGQQVKTLLLPLPRVHLLPMDFPLPQCAVPVAAEIPAAGSGKPARSADPAGPAEDSRCNDYLPSDRLLGDLTGCADRGLLDGGLLDGGLPDGGISDGGVGRPTRTRSDASVARLACEKCHRVRRISRCEPGFWNVIVAYLSAGLLYGPEVERPAWLNRQRRRQYAPHPTRAPSQTRARVLSLLLAGHSSAEVAATLHLTRGTVGQICHLIYKQHGVHSVKQLLARHNKPIPGQVTSPTKSAGACSPGS